MVLVNQYKTVIVFAGLESVIFKILKYIFFINRELYDKKKIFKMIMREVVIKSLLIFWQSTITLSCNHDDSYIFVLYNSTERFNINLTFHGNIR